MADLRGQVDGNCITATCFPGNGRVDGLGFYYRLIMQTTDSNDPFTMGSLVVLDSRGSPYRKKKNLS